MPTATFPPLRRARPGALLLTIAFHLALLLVWRVQTRPHPDAPGLVQRWLTIVMLPSPPAKQSVPVLPPTPQRTVSPSPARATPSTPEPVAALAPPLPAPPVVGLDELLLPPSATPHESTSDAVRRQALHDIAQIDRDLRKASPSQIHAPVDSAATRLAAGIERATRRPTLLEPAKIEPITDQTEFGRRIYKVTTALGSYCVYYESNHRAVVDNFNTGSKPHIGNCPREE